MNSCVYEYHQQQQKAAAAGMVGFGCVAELRRSDNCSNSFSTANTNGVVCPKPRRVVNFIDPLSIRSSSNQHVEAYESKAGIELLDIIRMKGGVEKSGFQLSSSPPFYSGSPPVRASNPLIQNEQFRNDKFSPLSPPLPPPSLSFEPPSSGVIVSRVRVNYRQNQQPNVRVEGFNCSVYAIA